MYLSNSDVPSKKAESQVICSGQLIRSCFLILVHPCDKPNKGGCDQTCKKDGETAVCECRAPEFKIGLDGKSCEPGKLLVT